ncbi:hypothetical protein GLW05_18510 [Pontibacillus yanchengensis]|uniref:Uncharacterized protein n=1 Tax=Pontibacillus yanchengensis TaxID=462910 RepID=A0A6I5A5M1_9BACI|nr:hypothetical protein [Pontibacillus yanchengensis]MYL35573.1 hypothetical protein [Pontibacillus yanchengensis]
MFLVEITNRNYSSLIKKQDELEDEIKHVSIDNPYMMHIILLELEMFEPYYPLGLENHKRYIKLKTKENEEMRRYKELIAETSNIDADIFSQFRSNYKKAYRVLSGNFKSILIGGSIGGALVGITAGLATPLIAPLFAATGLTAAALSSGLATLGGGAIAAGGAGMFGGSNVLVGGGTVFGAAGATKGMAITGILKSSSDYILRDVSKFDVVFNFITLKCFQDKSHAKVLLKDQLKSIKNYKEELVETEHLLENSEIKNLKKSISFLEKSFERNKYMLTKYVNEDSTN